MMAAREKKDAPASIGPDAAEQTGTPASAEGKAGTAPQAQHTTASPIPGEDGRPCFAVFDEWMKDGGKKYRSGVWYFGIKAGRSEDSPATLTEQWVCSPIHLDALTTDAHGGNFGRLLRLRTSLGEWRKWAMPMELLKADGADLRGELLAMGVNIDPGGHRLLARYLQHHEPIRRVRCVLHTGWAGADAFVLPDTVIGPGADGVVYQSGERGADEYTQAGSMDGWRAGVAVLAVGNPLLILALCTAFAGPVLARAKAESGGVHLVGDSSTGKTTAIEAACSVWGGDNYRRSWRTTANGMEGVAALFNDSLLALDEISECEPREVGAIVYSLGNGRGKQRASRTGAARAVPRWRCFVLSSGERTIGATMAEGGDRIKAGQSVRLLDVPANRMHGAWDDLHSHASGAAFSDALRNASKAHYGHAGRMFLRMLAADANADVSGALEAIKADARFKVDSGDGQAKRAAARFALLALAGELATSYGVTGWDKGAATEAVAECFRAWQALRGPVQGSMERAQVLGKVREFIERHGDSRFSDANNPAPNAVVRDRAGWWRDTDAGRVYLFSSVGMKEALSGFDLSRGLDVLQEAGALPAPGADGKRTVFRRIDRRGVKVYPVTADKLGE